MRLDKFLKVSRLIKRRSVANNACVNEKQAKASSPVKVGDIIEISFGNKNIRVRVLDIRDTTKKEEAEGIFEYI